MAEQWTARATELSRGGRGIPDRFRSAAHLGRHVTDLRSQRGGLKKRTVSGPQPRHSMTERPWLPSSTAHAAGKSGQSSVRRAPQAPRHRSSFTGPLRSTTAHSLPYTATLLWACHALCCGRLRKKRTVFGPHPRSGKGSAPTDAFRGKRMEMRPLWARMQL
jgi:hypothetical protein